MQVDVKVMRHPTRQQLVAYAETLVDRRAPVSAALASHVNSCRQCTQEVRQIRESLEFTRSASALEPSSNLTAQILMEAKKERKTQEVQQRRRRSPLWIAAQTVAFAAGVVVVATFVFQNALDMPRAAAAQVATTVVSPSNGDLSTDSLEKVGGQIKALSSAVRVSEGPASSLRERERLRAVSAIGTDIAAAKAALERNPGCVRATHIVNANMERGVSTLRDLYVEQTF